MARALDIIRSEHRSIAAVLDNLRRLAHGAAARPWRVDRGVFAAMVNYLENFADRVHHPKEDRYLFAAVRRHDPWAGSLVAGLEREHAGGEQALRDLRLSLERFEKEGGDGYAEFERAVEAFVQDYFGHMRREEEELFPLAEKLITPEEWADIDQAFEENRDPVATGELKL